MADTPAPDPETSFFKLNLDLDRDGEKDQVQFLVTYPKGRGMAAVDAMMRLGDYAPSLAQTLAGNGDESVQAALAAANIGLVDDDPTD